MDENLIDKMWKDRPVPSKNHVFIHDIKYCGCHIEEKLKKLHDLLNSKKCTAAVLNALDEIAWLLNLRGSDIDYNPMFVSYMIIICEAKGLQVSLYVDLDKFKDSIVGEYLKKYGVTLHPYEQVAADIKKLSDKAVGVEMDSVSAKILQAVKENNNSIIDLQDSIGYLKVALYRIRVGR